MNISTSALRNIEYGHTAPRLESLEKLSDFFKVSMDYLVRGVQCNEDNLTMFRETGLNDMSLAYLGEQVNLGKECGGLNDYISTLNALVTGGLLDLIWLANKLNRELSDIDKEIAAVAAEKPNTDNIVASMPYEGKLAQLQERRDLLKLRYFRQVEQVFDKLITKGDENEWHG
jgi:transcriptional regulator with XRE-family HTH domain